MKDAKGHGSDSHGGVSSQVSAVKSLLKMIGGSAVNPIRRPAAHQEGVREIPTAVNADKFVDQLRRGTMPDLSNVARAPGWIERFGKAARKGHSPV